jgi:hypothetical protein
MKKLWIVLLSAAMLMAFVMPAAAADLKVSGSYYIEGVYRQNSSNLDKENSAYNSALLGTNQNYAASKALYFQRLRFQPEVNVVEGLKLVMRFDALEKRWGDQTWAAAAPYDVDNRPSTGATGARTQENIEFVRSYVDFNTGIGRFLAGYQQFGTFGTNFIDTSFTKPGIKYFVPFGPVTAFLAYDKQKEKEVTSGSGFGNGLYADMDKDEYYIGAIYKQGDIEAGAQIQYVRDAANRVNTGTTGSIAYMASELKLYLIDPYFKGKFGPVFIEAEGFYGGGKLFELENASNTYNDVDVRAWGLYLHARVDISMFYGGFYFAWVSGDDPSTPDKVEGGIASTGGFLIGQNWSPTLIFKNDDHATYTGGVTGALHTSVTTYGGFNPITMTGSNATNQFMDNIWFYQLYFGVKPTPKWDISAKIAYAYADKKPWQTPATLGVIGSTGNSATEYVSNKYGTEVDLIATYKIYDNLQYMVGFGYFWVGDYYKGYYTTANEPKLENDYLFMHRLTLTF